MIRVLGPVEVWVDQQPLRLERRQQRIVLGLLALELGEFVTADRLIETAWTGTPPGRVRSILQTRISEMRTSLARALSAGQRLEIESHGTAYRLDAPRDSVDAHVFLEAVRLWRDATSIDEARTRLDDALALWRGPLMAGVALKSFTAAADTLHAAKLTAHEDLFAIELTLGHHSRIVDDVLELARANPTRERLLGMSMVALYLGGRTAEALNLFSSWRTRLRKEFGVDPGAEVQQIHLGILHDDGPDAALASALISQPLGHLRPSAPSDAQPGRRFVATVPRTAPQPIADFTGRRQEISTLLTLLADESSQLIAISGPAGVGKTALSVAVAYLSRSQFPDGQLFADLRGSETDCLSSAYDVLGRFLHVLGVDTRPSSLDERVDLYKSILASRRLLVVLDNVTSDDQVSALLPGGPGCRAIINSRVRLGHTLGAHGLDLSLMPDRDATRLLEVLVGPARVRSEKDAAASLVRQCGNLPLAIRIAGAKLATKPHWTIGRIVDMLKDEHHRLAGLTHGHLNVRASIALSFDGLAPETQRLLRFLGRLGLPDFAPWLSAALLDIPLAAAEEYLEELFDAQLIDVTRPGPGDHIRYKLHDLIRLFAWESADATIPADELRSSRARVYQAYLSLTEAATHRLQGGAFQTIRGSAGRWPLDPDVTAALVAEPSAWFDTEYRAIIAMAYDAVADGLLDECWELAFASQRLFQMRRYYDDWQPMVESLGARLDSTDNLRGRGAIHYLLGLIYSDRADYPESSRHYDIALDLFHTLDDQHAVATVESYYATVERYRDDDDAAVTRYERAYAHLAGSDDLGGRAFVLRGLGQVYTTRGDFTTAEDFLGRALTIYQDVDSPSGTAQTLFWTSMLKLKTGRLAAAVDGFQEALDLARIIHDRVGEMLCLRGVAQAATAAGDLDTARARLKEALKLARQPGPTKGENAILQSLAELDEIAAKRDPVATASR